MTRKYLEELARHTMGHGKVAPFLEPSQKALLRAISRDIRTACINLVCRAEFKKRRYGRGRGGAGVIAGLDMIAEDTRRQGRTIVWRVAAVDDQRGLQSWRCPKVAKFYSKQRLRVRSPKSRHCRQRQGVVETARALTRSGKRMMPPLLSWVSDHR